MYDGQGLVTGIASSIVAAGALSATSIVSARLVGRSRARRLWRFTSYSDAVIVTALSVETDTGEYSRPATGLGQARALASLAPSLARATREIVWQNLLVPGQCDGHDLERDLIVLGGPKNNSLTARLLACIDHGVLPDQHDSTIALPDGTEYAGLVSAGCVETDFGLVISIPNPYAPDRRAVILSGSHTYGVDAAARWWTRHTAPGQRATTVYAAVVGCAVQGHEIAGLDVVWETALKRGDAAVRRPVVA